MPVVDNKAMARTTSSPQVAPPLEFTRFFQTHYRQLMLTAACVDATEQEAEDAVAAAMEEILRRWDEIGNPLAYGRRAVVSHFLKDKERGLRRIRQRMVERGEDMPEAAGDTSLTIWEDREWVRQMLESLPPAQREVMAGLVDGFTPTEIAELLGRTPAAVRQSLHAARTRLRVKLTEQEKDGQRPSRTPRSLREEAR